MNKLIEQLVEQAGGGIGTGLEFAVVFGEMEDVEKFVESIVKETMQVVANQLPSNQYLDVAHAVIEHFGVEE
jgi:hypothetical protein